MSEIRRTTKIRHTPFFQLKNGIFWKCKKFQSSRLQTFLLHIPVTYLSHDNIVPSFEMSLPSQGFSSKSHGTFRCLEIGHRHFLNKAQGKKLVIAHCALFPTFTVAYIDCKQLVLVKRVGKNQMHLASKLISVRKEIINQRNS